MVDWASPEILDRALIRIRPILTIKHCPNSGFRAWLDMWERASPDSGVRALPDTCVKARAGHRPIVVLGHHPIVGQGIA